VLFNVVARDEVAPDKMYVVIPGEYSLVPEDEQAAWVEGDKFVIRQDFRLRLSEPQNCAVITNIGR